MMFGLEGNVSHIGTVNFTLFFFFFLHIFQKQIFTSNDSNKILEGTCTMKIYDQLAHMQFLIS